MAPAPERRAAPGRRARGRLSRSGDFERVYREGRSRANRYLVLYTFPRSEEAGPEPRLGLSVGRKLGAAVERNRVKRLLRETFWAAAERLPPAHDFVLVARPDAAALIAERGADGLAASLGELLDEDRSGDASG